MRYRPSKPLIMTLMPSETAVTAGPASRNSWATAPITLASVEVLPEAWSVAPTNSRNSFFSPVNAWPTVCGILAKSASICGATLRSASATTSAVSLPSSASLRSAPSGTPMPSAMACARPGVCSITELNSSPRRAPAPRPWPSCSSAAEAAWADAPEIPIA